MDNQDTLLTSLYEKEKILLTQLEAVQNTIKAFGGNIKPQKSVFSKVEKEERIPTPINLGIKVGPIKSSDSSEIFEKPEFLEPIYAKERPRNKTEDLYNFIIEILKEVNAPCKPKLVTSRLKEMGLEYSLLTIDIYIRKLEKAERIIQSGPGLFAHKDYIVPKQMERKVKTIYDILQYIEMRKQSTRQELLNFFVTGGRFNESRLDLRIKKLIDEKKISRIENGVYKFLKK